jgi:hypothetical protein
VAGVVRVGVPGSKLLLCSGRGHTAVLL